MTPIRAVKSQLRRANAVGARVALLARESELAESVVMLKDLAGRTQDRVPCDRAVPIVVDRIVARGGHDPRALAAELAASPNPEKGNA